VQNELGDSGIARPTVGAGFLGWGQRVANSLPSSPAMGQSVEKVSKGGAGT